ncbi:MAG: 4Fe-4S dicluster domain-containing protein [Desulfomonilaceae bacterium]
MISMKTYMAQDLEKFDGSDGGQVLVAVNGKVYDVSQSNRWGKGLHMNMHGAGRDLTQEIRSAPHGLDMLERTELVGSLIEFQEDYSESSGSVMQKYKNALLIDASLCIGCGACQAACTLEHELPEGPLTFRIIRLGPIENADNLSMSFMPTTCFHCDKPACVVECPTGAMQKREDGIVFSDLEICIGCQTCSIACPYGIPVLNPTIGKIAKCDGCKERVELGMWPACALICPTGAITFGSCQTVVQDRQHREAVRLLRMVQIR